MSDRRRFLSIAGAASLSLLKWPELRAAGYDLLIKGGRVIDPASNFDRVADVAIAGGRIAAVRPGISTSSAVETIDADGKLVVPGLIDIHTHAVREIDDAGLCLLDGVTSLVDAGSRGSDRIDEAVEVARTAPNRMRLLINEGQITHQQMGLTKVLDLGESWQRDTGLPLPLGVNVMRRELGDDVHRAISQGLRDSIAWAHANVDEALDYAMRYGRGIDKETCRRFVLMYVNNYTLSLGPDGRAAVERLFMMARDRGLIGEIPALDPI